MIKNGAGGGGGAVSHVSVTEGLGEHSVNDGDYNLTKCLLGLVVLAEDGGGNFMSVSQVGDLGS